MESTTEQEVENHEAENKDTNIVLSWSETYYVFESRASHGSNSFTYTLKSYKQSTNIIL